MYWNGLIDVFTPSGSASLCPFALVRVYLQHYIHVVVELTLALLSLCSVKAFESVIIVSLVDDKSFSCSSSFFYSRGMMFSCSRIDSTCLQSLDWLFFPVHTISETRQTKRMTFKTETEQIIHQCSQSLYQLTFL